MRDKGSNPLFPEKTRMPTDQRTGGSKAPQRIWNSISTFSFTSRLGIRARRAREGARGSPTFTSFIGSRDPTIEVSSRSPKEGILYQSLRKAHLTSFDDGVGAIDRS